MHKHGCHNRSPFKPFLYVKNGINIMGGYQMDKVPFRMSPNCEYTKTELGQKDQSCTGCKWMSL
jgi:hypothetical protein